MASLSQPRLHETVALKEKKRKQIQIAICFSNASQHLNVRTLNDLQKTHSPSVYLLHTLWNSFSFSKQLGFTLAHSLYLQPGASFPPSVAWSKSSLISAPSRNGIFLKFLSVMPCLSSIPLSAPCTLLHVPTESHSTRTHTLTDPWERTSPFPRQCQCDPHQGQGDCLSPSLCWNKVADKCPPPVPYLDFQWYAAFGTSE